MEKLISLAGNELVMLQDPDDLAHPQRLAIPLQIQIQLDTDLVSSRVAHLASLVLWDTGF